MRRVPRRQLHADFLRAVRASGHGVVTLAALANYPTYTNLTPFLNGRPVPATELHVYRLQTLATLARRSLVTYLTGWRSSEILKMEWRQVDMKAGEVRLDPGTTKNREGRVFPFTAELRELLKALHVEHEALKKKGTIGRFVFHQPNAPELRVKHLRRPWANACKKAGCPGRIFHDLRRSAARNFVRSGIAERVAMRLLGHKTRSIFDRYNIVSSGDLLDAALKMDAVTATVTTAGDKQAK